MDKRTKLAALNVLAKAAAELAADVATATSEAAGLEHSNPGDDLPAVRANLLIGTILPAEQALEEVQAIFRAMHALHNARAL